MKSYDGLAQLKSIYLSDWDCRRMTLVCLFTAATDDHAFVCLMFRRCAREVNDQPDDDHRECKAVDYYNN